MALLKFLYLLSFLAVSWSCPFQEDLLPCTCKPVIAGFNIVCTNFNSSIELKNAFRTLKREKANVFILLIQGVHIENSLPTDLFNDMKINQITVKESKLRLPRPVFSGLDSILNVLNVADNSLVINSGEQFILARLKDLDELYIKSNHLEKVRDNMLNEKVPNVKTIELDSNDISEIEDRAFANLISLKKISLADNRIKVIRRSMFPNPATHLTRIDISFNEIRSLPENIFETMPALKEVILSGNELKNLPESTWDPVWEHLNQVLLFDNPLECDESMDWIKERPKPYNFDGYCVSPKSMSGRSVKDI
ncbi:hypothetical protein CEXT_797551 [Caerostris extrusa]|uniref:Uncharacterized protein n=1 Tax=Caerostris extrusa TaxID=172846 RepID=A0AAV4UQL0_CAEEX|nr:hypothetical protein CEXT_797551 [Caerostris extrusa]